MNLRKVTEDDRAKIEEWIAGDPYHAGKGSADFFFEPGSETMAITDDTGDVFFLRIARSLRLNVLFGPHDKMRVARTLKNAIPVVGKMASESGFKDMSFSTENGFLAKFTERLGFNPQADLVMPLQLPEQEG